MQKRSRVFRTALLLSALALVGAACSEDDPETAEATDDTTNVADTADDAAEGDGGEEAEADRADWPEKLVFAAVPSEQNEKLQESYASTIEILEDDLGVEIEFFQAADYAGVIEAMIAGRVDIGQFGPFSYVIAKANGAEIDPIGAMIDEPGAEPGYQSYGIVPAGSDITDLAGFAGKKVCFVDPGSTSGFLYPSAGLLELGIDPEEDVEPIFAGGHDASAISVKNGECDAGFAFDSMVETELIESGDLAEGDLEVVWKSEVIAGSPVAMLTTLPDSLQEALRTTFIEKVNVEYAVESGVCAAADDCSFSDEDNYGYAAVEDDFYDGVRAVCEVTKAAQCEGVS